MKNISLKILASILTVCTLLSATLFSTAGSTDVQTNTTESVTICEDVQNATAQLLESNKTSSVGTTNKQPVAAKTPDRAEKEYLPIIIIPGIGQTPTYLLDENGNRMYDESGKAITGWPLYVDSKPIISKLVLPAVRTLITQKDNGFSDLAADVVSDAFYVNECKPDGTPVNNLEVPRNNCPFSELSEEEKNELYKRVPVQEYGKIAGEDKIYFFGYNSTGDVTTLAKELQAYIEMVKEQSGSEQVSLVPISMGGTVACAWLEMFKENYDDVHKIVMIVPAADGSNIVGDLMINNITVNDDKYLYNSFFPKLMDDSWTSYLVNILLRILPNDVLHSILDKLVSSVLETFVLKCPNLWALVPSDYFDEAYALHMADRGSEYKVLKEKLKLYHRAQLNLQQNISDFKAQGGIIHDICEYGLELYPISMSSLHVNSDTIIQSSSTSMHATFADVGKTLGDTYVQQNTNCTDPAHNHISPQNDVDASTGYLPDNTWFVRGLNHEETSEDDNLIHLVITLLKDDQIKNVFSDPEHYPQFNNTRLTKYLRKTYIPAAEQVDLSALTPEQAQELTTALEDCKAMLNETIVDTENCNSRIDRLVDILAEIGAISVETPSPFEDVAKVIFKFTSEVLSKYYGDKGFADWCK